jgi:predicted dehydrogenase
VPEHRNSIEHGPLRVGVAGVGNVGAAHARELAAGRVPGAALAAVADTNPSALAAFPEARCFASGAQLIASGAIEALIIATPHYAHTPLAIQALGAGLHVLVEKPLAVHKADCLQMIAAYERRPNPRQVFAEMLSFRIDPAFLHLRALLGSGALGRLRRILWVSTHWFRSDAYFKDSDWRGTWRGEGGGVLLNQCPHQLDLWQWLFGMPQHVHAFCGFGRFHQIEVEDQVTAYLAHEDGLNGVFIASTGEAPGTNRLEINGDLGKLVLDAHGLGFTRNAAAAPAYIVENPGRNAQPQTTHELFTFPPLENPRRVILANFAATILEGEALIAPASEGMASVELANAMIYSGITGQAVTLPLDPALYATELARLVQTSPARQSQPPHGGS